MAISINGKKYTPTAAAKRIIAAALPSGGNARAYLDAGVRLGGAEEKKLQEALAKQTARIRRLLGVA